MTHPDALPQPSQDAARNDLRPPTASDVLLHLLLTLLAPMFFLGSNGDVHFARMARSARSTPTAPATMPT